jgi:hypothetical protein
MQNLEQHTEAPPSHGGMRLAAAPDVVSAAARARQLAIVQRLRHGLLRQPLGSQSPRAARW